jgi:hypothetical protein
MAGEPRDARDDDEGTEVEMDDDGDEGGAEEELSLEDAVAKIKELEGSLAKANRERARLGRKVAAKTTPAPPKKAAADKQDDDGVSPDSLARLNAATQEAQTWKSRAIKKDAEVALAKAGVDAKLVTRAARLLDTDDLDYDDDGNLTGIDDQIDDLKADWPILFEKPKAEVEDEPEPKRQRPPRDRRANRDAGDKADKGAPAKDVEAQRFEAMFGGRGR